MRQFDLVCGIAIGVGVTAQFLAPYPNGWALAAFIGAVGVVISTVATGDKS